MLLIRNKECHSDEAVIKTLAVWACDAANHLRKMLECYVFSYAGSPTKKFCRQSRIGRKFDKALCSCTISKF